MTYDALNDLESRLAQGMAGLIPTLGLNGTTLKLAAHQMGISGAELSLICPNGPKDIAALIWRQSDEALKAACPPERLDDLKIREKISLLLRTRIALQTEGVEGETLARRLTGFLALPQHFSLYKRLIWETSDLIWRKAGDQTLDENHYSKRLLVSGIFATALLTRLSQGLEACDDQIARYIDQVMAFEKFKAKMPFKPDVTLLKVFERLGKWRFGST
jgi:ubiquinone biosynthesis protein COQ9